MRHAQIMVNRDRYAQRQRLLALAASKGLPAGEDRLFMIANPALDFPARKAPPTHAYIMHSGRAPAKENQ